jgi:hypothetical protein
MRDRAVSNFQLNWQVTCSTRREASTFLSVQIYDIIIIIDSVEITNEMQPCNRMYYYTIHWRLNMFRAAYRSSSGALTVFAASVLHTHVVTGRSQVWVQFPLRLDYGRSPHVYANQRLQIQLELLMISGMPFETCWAFNERWNNKFCYKVASFWLFLLSLYKILCKFTIPLHFKIVRTFISSPTVIVLRSITVFTSWPLTTIN